MKKQNVFVRLLLLILTAFLLSMPVLAKEASLTKQEANQVSINDLELYPGGMPFGVKIVSKGLTVVRFSETTGKNASSAYESGIREGDIIIKVNGKSINTIEDFVKQVDKNGNKCMSITVIRDKKEMLFSVTPKYSQDDGKYKTGIWVKDSTSGIGTITFIDPKTNTFAGLGHAICDSTSGKIVPMSKGIVMDVNINGVVKGQIGSAGELKGSFKGKKIGSLYKNSSQGVFGVLADGTITPPEDCMRVCPKEEIKEGEAYIWCTLDEHGPQKYKINISSIDSSNSNTKNFRIRVTDEDLLEKTGGIIQGMSGSPIIQNGRIVGAVTHVLINDPTSGYGIFIENMLNQVNTISI